MEHIKKWAKYLLCNPVAEIIGGFAMVYVGLGWLGFVDGWSETRSIMSNIFACIFVLSGGATVIQTISKQIKNRTDIKLPDDD